MLTYRLSCNNIIFMKHIKLNKSFCCKMKKLLIQFQYIYDELKDEHEIAIAEKYYYIARRYTSILTS
jgi:hypothetical protein